MAERIDLSEIKLDTTNANRHTERGEKMIRESINDFGFAEAGTLDKNNRLIGGNLRTEAAKDLGMDEAIILDVDGSQPVYIRRNDLDLTDDDTRAKELAYALNRVPQVSIDFNPEQVLADITAGTDLRKWFEKDEIDNLLADLKQEPLKDVEPQIDKAAELQKEWGTELGQVWTLGEHRLAVGDCTDRAVVEGVMEGKLADCLIADPPYGMNLNTDYSGMKKSSRMDIGKGVKGGKKYLKVVNDDKPFDPAFLINYFQ